MKAILEFNLPEEKEDHLDALNGTHYKIKIDQLYNDVFRPIIKYGNPVIGDKLTDEHYELVSAIWTKVSEYLEEE